MAIRVTGLSLLALALLAGSAEAQVHVRGYTKKDGTYVAPYERTAPNSTKNDNYSTLGNVNPYTGQAGTKPGDGGLVYAPTVGALLGANTSPTPTATIPPAPSLASTDTWLYAGSIGQAAISTRMVGGTADHPRIWTRAVSGGVATMTLSDIDCKTSQIRVVQTGSYRGADVITQNTLGQATRYVVPGTVDEVAQNTACGPRLAGNP